MKAIFGLGNPGEKYKNNRHNIGYRIVEQLAREERVLFRRSFRLNAYVAKIKVEGEDTRLIKPRTFMNYSGLCVKKALDNYKICCDDCLVVYDDVNLLKGILRFRERGSSGGHQGMASVINSINTAKISRLRVGIGAPDEEDLTEYVLSDFSPQEKKILRKSILKAASACRDWASKGSAFVMRHYNEHKVNTK